MKRLALASLVLFGCGAARPSVEGDDICPRALRGADMEECVGLAAEQLLVAAHGVYVDDALESYVREVGERIVAVSDRPSDRYRFVLLDDPYAQAWAVPGRRVLITRGLLARLGSEAELASLLAHEIGHVTAGHLEHVTEDFAFDDAAGLSRALEHDRDQERQADQLAVLLVRRAGYDVRAVDAMLRATDRGNRDGEDTWADRHPPLAVRLARVARAMDGESGGSLGTERYLSHLEGLVVGRDPREGRVREGRFESARGGFALALPEGWIDPQAGDPARTGHVFSEWDAEERNGLWLVCFGPAGRGWPEAALRRELEAPRARVFAGLEGVEGALVSGRAGRVHLDDDVEQARVAVFTGRDGAAYGLFVVSRDPDTAAHEARFRSIVAGLEPAATSASPRRLRVRRVEAPTTLRALSGCATEQERDLLAILNEVPLDESVPAGRQVKCIAR